MCLSKQINGYLHNGSNYSFDLMSTKFDYHMQFMLFSSTMHDANYKIVYLTNAIKQKQDDHVSIQCF